MSPFTRSKMRQATAIPYSGSVTKLHAYDLLEEGTQCPNCHAEILPNQFVYLHRACSNLVCASCFETNLPQYLNCGLCLICQAKLSEPCAEDVLPNWRFTYTTFLLPDFASPLSTGARVPHGSSAVRRELAEDAMAWSLQVPASNLAPFAGELPVAGFNRPFGAVPSPVKLLADLAKLRAEVSQQNTTLDNFMGSGVTSRDIRRIPRQSNTNVPYPNFTNLQSQNITDLRPSNTTNPEYQTNTNSPSQNNPRAPPTNDMAFGPRYVPNPWTQPNTNSQYENGTHIGRQPSPQPRPPPSPRKRRNGEPEHRDNTGHGGQRPCKPRRQKPKPLQHGRPGGKSFGDGRDPAMKHHWQGPRAQLQTHQSQAPPQSRVSQWNQPHNECQSDSSQNQTNRPPITYRETRPRKIRKRRSYNLVEGSLAGSPVPEAYHKYFKLKNTSRGSNKESDTIE